MHTLLYLYKILSSKKKLFIVFFLLGFSLFAQNLRVHTVKEGETLRDIASEYRMAPSDIVQSNKNINFDEELKPGMTILIPIPGGTPNQVLDSIQTTGRIIDYKYHTVGENETVYSLSKQYHSKIESILKLNNIEGFDIKLGQILIIPIYADENQSQQIDSTRYTFYIVKPKQGKWRVAYDHGITIDELERLNPEIKDTNLKVGQKLVVPKFRAIEATEIRDESKYIYHEVMPKETLFSLSKQYEVPIDTITVNNPALKNGLKAGQTIKIPRKEKLTLPDNNTQETVQSGEVKEDFLYHDVAPKETLFSLAKHYQVTIDDLMKLNPELKDGLKEGQRIKIKKIKTAVEPVDNQYIYHEVQPQETLFSLAKRYYNTIDEIKELNPELQDDLKTGQKLKLYNRLIPTYGFAQEGEAQIQINLLDSINKEKPYRLAILLPFKLKNLSALKEDQKCDVLTNNSVLDYYSGIKLAIDSLKNYGMNISYDVYDTQGSTWVTDKIIEATDLSDYDFVIGPIKKENIEKVATILELDNTPQVVHKYKGDKEFRNLIITSANNEGLSDHIIHYLNEKAEGKNIVVVYDESKQQELDSLMPKFGFSPQLVKGKKTKNGFTIYMDQISKKLDKNKSNYIILLSDNEPFIFTVLSSLNSLLNQYPITLFTLDDKKLYEDDTNDRTNTFLSNLNYHFPSKMIRLIDPKLKKSFYDEYHSAPGFAAVNGFDSTFDVLLRAGNADNLFEGLQKIGKTKQTSKVFLYRHKPEEGFKNTGSVILKLNKDLELEIVE